MNLTEIKKSLEEISPWPWFFSYHKRKSGWWLVGKRRKKTGITLDSDERCAQDSHHDMFFIAKAPETISFLISEIERLKLDEITRLGELETMALENTKMKEALSFYANPSNWVKRETELGGLSLMNHDDHGRAAREALYKVSV